MKGHKWISLGGGLLVTLICLSLLLLRPASVTLQNGMKVRFGGVSYGTNAFMHGNAIEKLLARWIPAKGWNLGGIKLRKPEPIYAFRAYGRLDPTLSRKMLGLLPSEKDEVPDLWFLFQSSAPEATTFMHDLNKYRVVAVSEDGTEFPNYFSGWMKRPATKEMFADAPLKFFPGTEKKIKLKLESLGQSGQWQSVANYIIVNPAQRNKEIWNVHQTTFPQTNSLYDFSLILTKASVGDSSTTKKGLMGEALARSMTPQSPAITALQLEFLLKMNKDSQINDVRWGRNWQIRECLARDRFGNELNWDSRSLKPSLSQDKPFTLMTYGQALPDELRKIEVTVAPLGLAQSPAASVTFTNLLIASDTSAWAQEYCLTNAFGVPIVARWSSDGLEIKLRDDVNDGLLATAKVFCEGCSEVIEKMSRDERRIIFNRVSDDRVNVEARAVRFVKLSYFVKPVLAK